MQIVLLASGSTGNCALIEAGQGQDRVVLVLDCGIAQRTGRDLAADARLSLTSVDAVLLTHAHADHSANVVAVAGRAKAPLYAHPKVVDQRPQLRVSEIARRKVELRPYLSQRAFQVGPLTITPIPLPHDAEPTHGFIFESENGQRAAYFSDLGHPEVLMNGVLEGVESLVLEFNYDAEMLANGPYPPHLVQRISGGLGHLSNEQSAENLRQACPSSLRQLTLAHLSRHNNRPHLAAEAARAALNDAGRNDLEPKIAPPRGVVYAGPNPRPAH
ncbi:MAG: MBL fold metallo-hydrolase [Planctomycetes bacterium]|nr:MBL fold metallo-hydrolase [Planctomycetota bacterium]